MRHVRKQQKSLMPKILLIVVLVAALSISSVVTVMANTADITVYDGSETYRFSMIGQNPQDILSRAQTEGMAPVSDIDTYDFSPENGTLTVQRFVRVSVKEDNASQMILAPKGKTLSDVFTENEQIGSKGIFAATVRFRCASYDAGAEIDEVRMAVNNDGGSRAARPRAGVWCSRTE